MKTTAVRELPVNHITINKARLRVKREKGPAEQCFYLGLYRSVLTGASMEHLHLCHRLETT